MYAYGYDEGVVVRLKLIQVDVEDGERAPVDGGALDAGLDGEVAGQARERIGVDALAAALEDHADAGQQLADVDGLRDEIVGAEVETRDLAVARAGGREDDHGKVLEERVLAQGGADLETGHARHFEVEDRDVGRIGADGFKRGGAVAHGGHDEALPLKGFLEGLEKVGQVVGDENRRRTARESGSVHAARIAHFPEN